MPAFVERVDIRTGEVLEQIGLPADTDPDLAIADLLPHLCPGEFLRRYTVPVNRRSAVLTWADVHEIRRRRRSGATLGELGRAYGVTRTNVSKITTGKTWREHIIEREAPAC